MKELNEKWITFLSTVLIGIITHGFMFYNKFSWHDDIGIVNIGASYANGRWGAVILADIYRFLVGEVVSMPVVEGFIFLVTIGGTSVLIGQLLQIKTRIGCIMLGGMMVVFPAVTAMFGFMFHVVWYALGIFFSVFGVYLFEYFKGSVIGVITNCIFVCLSLSMYQAFLPVTAALMLLMLQKVLFGNQEKCEYIFISKAVKFLFSLFVGICIYIVLAKWLVKIHAGELAGYQNIDQMGTIRLDLLLNGVKEAYRSFFFPWTSTTPVIMFMGTMLYVFYIVAVLCLILLIKFIIKSFKEKPFCSLLLLLTVILYPLAVNLFYLYGMQFVHGTMLYGQVMVFVLLIYLHENIDIFVDGMMWGGGIFKNHSCCCGVYNVFLFSICKSMLFKSEFAAV